MDDRTMMWEEVADISFVESKTMFAASGRRAAPGDLDDPEGEGVAVLRQPMA